MHKILHQCFMVYHKDTKIHANIHLIINIYRAGTKCQASVTHGETP